MFDIRSCGLGFDRSRFWFPLILKVKFNFEIYVPDEIDDESSSFYIFVIITIFLLNIIQKTLKQFIIIVRRYY